MKPPADLRSLPLVEVEWTDCTSADEWMEWKDAMTFTPVTIRTIGRLLRKTPKSITLVSHITTDGRVGNIIVIPRAWTHRLKRRRA